MTRCIECGTTVSKLREARAMIDGREEELTCAVCADCHPSNCVRAATPLGADPNDQLRTIADGGPEVEGSERE